jgi:hypothetical protein
MILNLEIEKHIYTIIFLPFVSLSIVEVFIGILQHFHIVDSANTYFTITGTLLNPARLAGFVGMALPMLLIPTVEKQHNNVSLKHTLLGLSLLCLIVIILTQNRSVVIGLICGIAYYLYRTKKILLTSKRIIMIGVIIISMGVALFFFKIDSANGRLLIWEICIAELHDKFLLGVGANNFVNAYAVAQGNYLHTIAASRDVIWLADFIQYPYNVILSILIEYGIFVLLLIIGIFLQLIKNRNNNPSILEIHIETSLVILLLYSMFSYPNKVPSIALFGIILIASLNAIQQKNKNNEILIPKNNLPLKIVVQLLLACLLGFQSYSLFLYHTIKKADKVAMYEYGHTYAINIYENAYWRFRADPIFLYKYGECLLRNENWDRAIFVLQSAIEKFPDPHIYDILSQAYMSKNDYFAAEKILKEGIRLIPSKFILKFKLFKLYLQQGMYAEAKYVAKMIDEQPVKVETHEILLIKQEITDFIDNFNY